MGYKIIKRTVDRRGIKYMKYTIKQAKCLKLDLEKIGREKTIVMDKFLVVKLDIEAMYPSINYELVAKAVRYYTKGFSREEELRLEADLDMLTFSMSNCLINFGPDYFQYGKGKNRDFDSTWLADLVACYIFEKKLNQRGKKNLLTSKFIATMAVHWPEIQL